MLTLHGYWRSSAAYRVRIALNLKQCEYAQHSYDLRKDEQRSPEYLAIAPHGLVPALECDGQVMIESPAILEWIEERFPEPALLPPDAKGRAVVRAMAAIIGCDIHPLNNLRVLNALTGEFGIDGAARSRWIKRWIEDGFGALDRLIAEHGGGYAFGEKPTLADCYTVPQAYSADRFGIDVTKFPHLNRAVETARAHAAISAAHPSLQFDADPPN